MRFNVLGPLDVFAEDAVRLPIPQSRQRALLAVLLLRANQPVSAGELTDLLWGEDAPAVNAGTLRTHIYEVRRRLAPASRLSRSDGRYLFEVRPGELDLHEFRESAQDGKRALACGDHAGAAFRLRRACSLWRNPPLADVPVTPTLMKETEHLLEERELAAGDLVEARLALGDHQQLVPELRKRVQVLPTYERAWEQLMLALYRSGRQVEALDSYARARAILVDVYGLDPGPRLQQLQRQILAGDPALDLNGTRQRNRAALSAVVAHPPEAGQDSTVPRPSGHTARPADWPALERAVPRQLPSAVWHFTGREVELAALDGLLEEADSAVVISAIGGMAGVGKTALALHWAHRVADRFPDGQLYVNLRAFDPSGTPVTAAEAILGFLDSFQIPAEQIPATLEAQTALYRSLLADRRMLILLDNARDVDQVRPLLPGSPGCLVLVTSRIRLDALVAQGAQLLTIDVLTETEARELLTRRLGEQRMAAEPRAADGLARLCAYLPLALNIAAAGAAARPRHELMTLAGELRDAHTRLDVLDAGDTTASVRAAFSWSYHRLARPVARIFRLLSIHPGPDFTTAAAASLAGVPLADTKDALDALTAAHMLAENLPGRFACHDLLRAYADDRTRAEEHMVERRAAVRRMLDHYMHTAYAADLLLNPGHDRITMPAPEPGAVSEPLTGYLDALAWFDAEKAVLLAAVTLAAETDLHSRAWQLPLTLATYLDRRGHWRDWAVTAATALIATQRLHDLNAQAEAHRNLARADIQLGSHNEARTHLALALGLYRQLGDHTGDARVNQDIGWLLSRQGRNREALSHIHLALALFQSEGDRPGQADALNAAGWQYALLGDDQQALSRCERALSLYAELGDRLGEADTLHSLGYAHYHLGHHAEALTCYRQAISLYRTVGDRHNQALALDHLALARQAVGQATAARDAWEQALAIFDSLGHPGAAEIRRKLQGLGTDTQGFTAIR